LIGVKVPALSGLEAPAQSGVEVPALSEVEVPALNEVEVPALSEVEVSLFVSFCNLCWILFNMKNIGYYQNVVIVLVNNFVIAF
jgi:hypothetical protein